MPRGVNGIVCPPWSQAQLHLLQRPAGICVFYGHVHFSCFNSEGLLKAYLPKIATVSHFWRQRHKRAAKPLHFCTLHASLFFQ